MAEQGLEDRPFEDTLAQAEATFHYNMKLIGIAQCEFREKLDKGEIPDPKDLDGIGKDLAKAWASMQTERDRVAEYNRKHGVAGAGELDLAAARLAVCEQLDRIAAAIAAG